MKFGKKTIALLLVATMGLSFSVGFTSAATGDNNPIAQIFQLLMGIDAKVDAGTQIVTYSRTVKFLPGTPETPFPSSYLIEAVSLDDESKAAEFKFTLEMAYAGDPTPEGSEFWVIAGAGSPNATWMLERGFPMGGMEREFVGNSIEISLYLSAPLEGTTLYMACSYTVTTDVNVHVIQEHGYPPTVP